ncbi:hypothetical protein CYY_004387 [Polysphondylium violaceum]|uniref:SET domain-containing protein n=1 Tax=Polysphondylium violaceum TaxID=133409 RepID=A0A8J4V0D4_9MYCE|nr:hypothetical protein CYY_004387 [Polysphondylium violaceum]
MNNNSNSSSRLKRVELRIPSSRDELYKELEQYKLKGNKNFSIYIALTENDLADDYVPHFRLERAIAYYRMALDLHQLFSSGDGGGGGGDNVDGLLSVISTNLSLCFVKSFNIPQSFVYAERAIQFDGMNPKAHYRRGFCLRNLGRHQESLEAYQTALKLSKDATLTKEITSELQQQREKIAKIEIEKQDTLFRIANDDQFAQFPITMEWREGMGRCVMAKQDITRGTTIARVLPFGSAIVDEHLMDNCGFCSSFINDKKTALPCKKCKKHVFCASCAQLPMALEHHKDECDLLAFLTHYYPDSNTRDFRFIIRVILSARRERVLKNRSKTTVPESWAQSPFIFDSFVDLLNLSRNSKASQQQEEAFEIACRSLFAVFKQVKGPDYLNFITEEEIMHVYHVVLSNGHEMIHPFTSETYGMGIFPTASYLNHSCLPNAFWYNDASGMLVFKAKRDIKQGEEITTSYLDSTDILYFRQKGLLESYFFYCQCAQCRFQQTLPLFKCTQCNEPLLDAHSKRYEPDATTQHDNGCVYQCTKCNQSYDHYLLKAQINAVNESSKSMQEITKTLDRLCDARGLHALKMCLDHQWSNQPKHTSIHYYLDLKIIVDQIFKAYQNHPNTNGALECAPMSLLSYYTKLFNFLKNIKNRSAAQQRDIQEYREKIISLLDIMVDLQTNHFKESIMNELKI